MPETNLQVVPAFFILNKCKVYCLSDSYLYCCNVQKSTLLFSSPFFSLCYYLYLYLLSVHALLLVNIICLPVCQYYLPACLSILSACLSVNIICLPVCQYYLPACLSILSACLSVSFPLFSSMRLFCFFLSLYSLFEGLNVRSAWAERLLSRWLN